MKELFTLYTHLQNGTEGDQAGRGLASCLPPSEVFVIKAVTIVSLNTPHQAIVSPRRQDKKNTKFIY